MPRMSALPARPSLRSSSRALSMSARTFAGSWAVLAGWAGWGGLREDGARREAEDRDSRRGAHDRLLHEAFYLLENGRQSTMSRPRRVPEATPGGMLSSGSSPKPRPRGGVGWPVGLHSGAQHESFLVGPGRISRRRRAARRVRPRRLVRCGLAGPRGPHARAGAKQTVVAGEEFDRSGQWRYWFGNGYRKAWTTPVELPVLDLETESGRAPPLAPGGRLPDRGPALRAGTARRHVPEAGEAPRARAAEGVAGQRAAGDRDRPDGGGPPRGDGDRRLARAVGGDPVLRAPGSR